MKSVEVFEWTFTPRDCFEQDFPIVIDGYAMCVTEGKAKVEIESELFEADPTIPDRLHDALNDYLFGAELIKACPVSLVGPERETVREDGKRIAYAEMISIGSATVFGHADVISKDADGNVIRDTKRDRIEGINSLGARIAAQRPKDRTLAKMRASYGAAMRDPGDELVHLYEIADALETRFGKRREAQAAIGVTQNEWGRFFRLCNESSLRQGRHRGQYEGPHRDATAAELQEVRALALKMIDSYLAYLERSAMVIGSRPRA